MYNVDHAQSRDALLSQLARFVEVCDGLSGDDLFAASHCHGWAALDVIVHVRIGLEEMLRGFVTRTTKAATADAASYWAQQAPAGGDAGDDVAGVMFLRRTASAYRTPLGAVEHLRDAVQSTQDAASSMTEGGVRFQGHVLCSGDFLATWAVELVLHQLDLGRELEIAEPDADALRLTRRTVEALAGAAFPAGWEDTDVVLVAAGRRAPTALESQELLAADIEVPVLH